jgi:hypothetical protein
MRRRMRRARDACAPHANSRNRTTHARRCRVSPRL